MKKKIILMIICAIMLQICGIGGFVKETSAKQILWSKGPNPDNLASESAIIMDINSGTILYEKNTEKKQYPASITKIMTTLLCLENASLTDTVTFSYEAVNSIEPGSSHIGIKANEQLKMEDCLYGIMLMSANEVCNGVAEHIAGSIEGFVDMMNERAKQLGCKNTHFANPNGLFLENHYTCAYDMALIAREAMKNPMFKKITGTKSYIIPKTNIENKRSLYNKHEMLVSHNFPQYRYDYCIGGKTGYTNLARYTLVTFAKKDNMELLCVIMKSDNSPYVEPNEYTDTTKLFDFAFDNFESHSIESKIENDDSEVKYSLFSKYNSVFDEENSPLYIEENASIVLPKGAKVSDAEKNVNYYENPIDDNGVSRIGEINYEYNGKNAGSAVILYDSSKIETAEINKHVTDYVNELDEEIDKKQEELEQKEKEKNNKAGMPIWKNKIFIGIVIVVVVIIAYIIGVSIYKARLRKRYFGSYRNFNRKGNKFKRKNYKF